MEHDYEQKLRPNTYLTVETLTGQRRDRTLATEPAVTCTIYARKWCVHIGSQVDWLRICTCTNGPLPMWAAARRTVSVGNEHGTGSTRIPQSLGSPDFSCHQCFCLHLRLFSLAITAVLLLNYPSHAHPALIYVLSWRRLCIPSHKLESTLSRPWSPNLFVNQY